MFKLSLPKFWYKKEIISYLLWPFSLIYRLGAGLSRFYYLHHSLPKFPVPIIVVGNITVGGTGKTPLVIYVAELFKAKGYRPGIISRGYGRKRAKGSIVVTPKSAVLEVGDEPLLMARRAICPVIVNQNRVAGVNKLIQDYNCNIVISDDGLQHYKLPRDIEIVVIDPEFRFGNGFCLPAGPLREPISRLKEVDLIVDRMILEPTVFRKVKNPTELKTAVEFKDKVIHAVAGIGRPKKFFDTLRQLNLNVIEHSFPDHYKFTASDFPFTDGIVVMTEKDAVKCEAFAQENFWYLEVQAKVDAELVDKLSQKFN